MYTNVKTGQTSSERPECDPYFVETDLFLKFTPEETEALSEVCIQFHGESHCTRTSCRLVHSLFAPVIDVAESFMKRFEFLKSV